MDNEKEELDLKISEIDQQIKMENIRCDKKKTKMIASLDDKLKQRVLSLEEEKYKLMQKKRKAGDVFEESYDQRLHQDNENDRMQIIDAPEYEEFRDKRLYQDTDYGKLQIINKNFYENYYNCNICSITTLEFTFGKPKSNTMVKFSKNSKHVLYNLWYLLRTIVSWYSDNDKFYDTDDLHSRYKNIKQPVLRKGNNRDEILFTEAKIDEKHLIDADHSFLLNLKFFFYYLPENYAFSLIYNDDIDKFRGEKNCSDTDNIDIQNDIKRKKEENLKTLKEHIGKCSFHTVKNDGYAYHQHAHVFPQF